jgi:hypothetical protein
MKTLFKLISLAFIALTVSGNALAADYSKLTTQFRESKNECLEGNQVNGSINARTCQVSRGK